jgi:alpha-glucosidase (family GH31 glycosyl hydrolase)
LKELLINLKNEFSYELETITSKNNINYMLMFKNEGNSDYKILFDSNFDILNIEIFYEDSNLINKIFLKQLKVNTKFNESEVKIDLDNYKDYFINRL